MKENNRTYDVPAEIRARHAKRQTEMFVDQLADADDKLHSFLNITREAIQGKIDRTLQLTV